MHTVDDEAMLPRHPLQQGRELVERHVNDATTVLTDEVMMLGHHRKMDHPRGMTRVDVVEVAALFQGVERSVHRRLVDPASGELLSLGLDVARAEMRFGRRAEDLADRSPCLGDAEALTTEGLNEIRSYVRHLRIVPVGTPRTVLG